MGSEINQQNTGFIHLLFFRVQEFKLTIYFANFLISNATIFCKLHSDLIIDKVVVYCIIPDLQ